MHLLVFALTVKLVQNSVTEVVDLLVSASSSLQSGGVSVGGVKRQVYYMARITCPYATG